MEIYMYYVKEHKFVAQLMLGLVLFAWHMFVKIMS